MNVITDKNILVKLGGGRQFSRSGVWGLSVIVRRNSLERPL